MAIEIQILKLFCDNRDTWQKYGNYFSQTKTLDREIKVIYNLISKYYEKYENISEINYQDLILFYDVIYPSSKSVMDNFHKEIINNLRDYDVNPDLITDLLEQMMERHYATRIINTLIPVMEGDEVGKLVSMGDYLSEYESKMKCPPELKDNLDPICLSVDDLVNTQIDDSGISWPLESINRTYGGIRQKTHGVIYAYVDSGKTSFAVACAAKFASQLTGDECICYCGNEEDAGRLNLRLTIAFTNMMKHDIVENPQKTEELRSANGFYRVKTFEGVRDFKRLSDILKKHEPTILFMDQATKIEVSGKEEGTKAMTARFNMLRDMATDYDCAIIGVCQATGDCEDKKWIRLSDMYESRVAIQGELDFAIGIGRVISKPELEDYRYFNLTKNKLGDGDYARFTVTFDKYRCKWEEV